MQLQSDSSLSSLKNYWEFKFNTDERFVSDLKLPLSLLRDILVYSYFCIAENDGFYGTFLNKTEQMNEIALRAQYM